MSAVTSRWDPIRAVLVTELRGPVDVAEVAAWRDGLQMEVDRIPDGTRFRLLLDLTGFEPAGLDAHKAMRTVVPCLLLAHGLRPAFLDLFPEMAEPEIRTERGVVCVAFPNVHHDPDKMGRYEERIATGNQRFFTSRAEGEEWLSSVGTAGWTRMTTFGRSFSPD